MKTLNFTVVFTFIMTSFLFAQTKTDSITTLTLDQITQVNQGESYITLPFDFCK